MEHASVCLTRIAESFASSPDKLDELCNHGLVAQSASLISTSNSGGGQSSLSTPTYTVSLICLFAISFEILINTICMHNHIYEGFNFDLQTIQGLIRLLSTCASGSPLAAKTLLSLGISGILKEVLSGSGSSSNTTVSPALSRPAEQVIPASFES